MMHARALVRRLIAQRRAASDDPFGLNAQAAALSTVNQQTMEYQLPADNRAGWPLDALANQQNGFADQPSFVTVGIMAKRRPSVAGTG